MSHLITEPGKVPSPVFGGCQLRQKEDEQLLSLRWADESRTRAHVPMDLPRCQFSRRSDEGAQSGGGRDVVSSRKPSFRHCGGDAEMDVFHALLPNFVFVFSFNLRCVHDFRFVKSE